MEHSTAKWTTMETRRDTGVPAKSPAYERVCLFGSPCVNMSPHMQHTSIYCMCTTAIRTSVPGRNYVYDVFVFVLAHWY